MLQNHEDKKWSTGVFCGHSALLRTQLPLRAATMLLQTGTLLLLAVLSSSVDQSRAEVSGQCIYSISFGGDYRFTFAKISPEL